jgi:hypothetical protein
VAAREEVAVPTQHRVRAYQQSEPTKRLRWESVQQGREEGPVARGEPRSGLAQLAFQDRDLVAQYQDLHVFVPTARTVLVIVRSPAALG